MELAERIVRATTKKVELIVGQPPQTFYIIDDVPAFIRRVFLEEIN